MRHDTGAAATPPVRVEVTRGSFVESEHLVTWVLADTHGTVLAAAGDPDLLVPPRSAMKSLQALAVVAEGAADAHRVAGHELALACASHSGEDGHVEAVGAWLERIGLGPDDLGCGAAWPLDAEAARRLAARGGEPSRVHHNCSGKHAGFLTLARHLGVSPRGYLDPAHPVQQRVLTTVADLTGVPVDRGPVAVDGCGAPVVALPLRALARAVARLAAGSGEPARRLVDAMVAHPWHVAGTGRLDTRLLVALGGAGFTKVGAEGNMVAGLGDGTALAVKAHDGAGRAAGVAVVELLVALGRLDPGAVIDAPERGTGDAVTVADLMQAPVTNAAGDVVGVVRVAAQDAERMAAATSPHRS